MTDQFNAPAAGGRFSAKDHKGKLLIVTPLGYKEDISTTFGIKDAVEANVTIVDETNPGNSEDIEGALLFGGVLIGQTKAFIGKGLVLGRLEQGMAKPGQQPPWRLADPTDADKAKASAYLASKAPQF